MNVMTRISARDADDPQPFKLRFEHYEMLDRAGTFADRRVELIEGTLMEMSPQQRPHSNTKNELTFRLRGALVVLGSHFPRKAKSRLLYARTADRNRISR